MLPWWKKHDKVCAAHSGSNLWENTKKCPWGDFFSRTRRNGGVFCSTTGAAATAVSEGQECFQPVAQTTWPWCSVILQTGTVRVRHSTFCTLDWSWWALFINPQERRGNQFLKLATLLSHYTLLSVVHRTVTPPAFHKYLLHFKIKAPSSLDAVCFRCSVAVSRVWPPPWLGTDAAIPSSELRTAGTRSVTPEIGDA